MIRHALLALAASTSLAACVTIEEPGSDDPATGGGNCNAQPGQVLIGQQATTENGTRAMQLTGARTLRWGPPDAVFTMDFREDRVNVMYDQNMSITEIRCG